MHLAISCAVCASFWHVVSWSLEEAGLNLRHHIDRVHPVIPEFADAALPVDQVLAKVPNDFVGLALHLKLLVKGVNRFSLHIAFPEDWESDAVHARDKLLDHLLRIGLLSAKLVAGESQNLQASRTVSIVHLLVLPVVRVGLSSFRSDVHHDDGLGVSDERVQGHLCFLSDSPHWGIKN